MSVISCYFYNPPSVNPPEKGNPLKRSAVFYTLAHHMVRNPSVCLAHFAHGLPGLPNLSAEGVGNGSARQLIRWAFADVGQDFAGEAATSQPHSRAVSPVVAPEVRNPDTFVRFADFPRGESTRNGLFILGR